MHFVDVIAKKRDGHALSRGDIDQFVQGNGGADSRLPVGGSSHGDRSARHVRGGDRLAHRGDGPIR